MYEPVKCAWPGCGIDLNPKAGWAYCLKHKTQKDYGVRPKASCIAALREAKRVLSAVHSLLATNAPNEYTRAKVQGLDAESAWERFRAQCFVIDASKVISAINAVLPKEGK